MKTQDFVKTMTAFSGLLEASRAEELRKFASTFRSGNDETITARIKKMSRATGHPAKLKQCLELIQAGFKAAGATKQATELGVVLGAFVGRDNATTDEFINQITALPAPKKRPQPIAPTPDHSLARTLADELARTLLDAEAFTQIIDCLNDKKGVNTPTLAAIANRFLGNSKKYTGRKNAIEDIIKRQKADAREHARGTALNRIGV